MMRPYTLKGLKEKMENYLNEKKINAVVEMFPIKEESQFREFMKQVNNPK